MILPTPKRQSAHRCASLLADSKEGLILRVLGGENDGRVIRLRSRKCTIGSLPSCTLRLASDDFQPVHCLIVRGRHGTVVRRWSDSTWLNGADFVDDWLHPGDRIGLGRLELEVISDVYVDPVVSPRQDLPSAAPKRTAESEVDAPDESSDAPPNAPAPESRMAPVAPTAPDAPTARGHKEVRSHYRPRFRRLVQQLRESKRDVDQLNGRIELQSLRQESLESEIQQLKDAFAAVESQNESSVAQQQYLEQQTQDLEQQKQDLEQQTQQLELLSQKLFDQQAEFEAERDVVSAQLERDREEWEETRCRKEQELDQQRDECRRRQEELQQQLDDVQEVLTQHRNELAAEQDERATLIAETQELSEERDRLRREIAEQLEIQSQREASRLASEAELSPAENIAAPPATPHEVERQPSAAEDDAGPMTADEVQFLEADPAAPADTASILARFAPNLLPGDDADGAGEKTVSRGLLGAPLHSRGSSSDGEAERDETEESIQDYMSELMRRMGASPLEVHDPAADEASPCEDLNESDDEQPEQAELELTEEGMFPRTERPQIDLVAMRAVANESARRDISRHQFQLSIQEAMVNWCLAAAAFIIGGGLLYWSNRLWSLKAAEAFLAFGAGAYWMIKGIACYKWHRHRNSFGPKPGNRRAAKKASRSETN